MRTLIVPAIMFFMISQTMVFSMDQSVKDKMEIEWQKFNAWRKQHNKICPTCGSTTVIDGNLIDSYCLKRSQGERNLRETQNRIILNAGNLVSDQEKLNKLYGDDVYDARKDIIKKMVQDGTNPSNIQYQFDKTPLREAIFKKDKEFAQFLIQRGAVIDNEIRKRATPEFLATIAQQ